MKIDHSSVSIPFNRLYRTGREMRYLRDCLQTGSITGNGAYTRRCESLLEKEFGAKRAILTTSCTDALEMASLLLDVGPGDEVILPSYTFVSTANAFILRGAIPKFVDIREDTLNIDDTKIEEKVSEKTKVIVPVHYAGVSCEMDRILAIARSHRLAVVEDAAQGVNARYGQSYLGTLGDLGTFSFHGTKNFTCGEGGALLVNRDELAERAEILREKGTNRRKFLNGEVDKYTWVDIGSSYLIADLLAAFLLSQLETKERITRQREAVYQRYQEEFEGLEKEGKLQRPIIPSGSESNYHLYHVLLPSEATRNAVMATMKREGIQAVFHYIPLHSSPMGARFGCREGDLPVTESVSRRILRLPLYPDLSRREQDRVIATLRRSL